MKAAKFLLLILTVAIVVPMHAQSTEMKVNIPFDFSVDNHQMLSGNYVIKSITQNTVLIRTADGAVAHMSLTEATGGGVKYKSPALIFQKQGEQYFLASAFFGHVTIGRQFAPAKHEPVRADQVVLSQTATD